MGYSIMGDEEIIRDLAQRVEQLRISKQIKEKELEESSGISRKTFYNFKQGATGFSLKNLIRVLRALDELDRLEQLFSEGESYSPREGKARKLPKRVRDKQGEEKPFQWGDEQ